MYGPVISGVSVRVRVCVHARVEAQLCPFHIRVL